MHKGVILLVKASNKKNAVKKVIDFMEEFKNSVWDWYQIGGRWNNTLAPKEKVDQFHIKADNQILKKENGFLSQEEVNAKQSLLQEAWEEEGLKGKNPYCDHYNLPDTGNEYDVIPLNDCAETVKSWLKNLQKEQQEIWDKMIEAKNEADDGKYDMSGFYAGIYYDLNYGNFCFESNVYNCEEREGESMPEDTTGYFAVIVDMHN